MKKISLTFIAVFAAYLLFNVFSNVAISNPTGAPAGKTGSPADGQTCSQSNCHTGTPTVVAGIITSDVPVTGYVGGTTYNMTVTLTGTGAKGFQVSPQSTAGLIRGSLIAGSGNKIVSTKYITHSSEVNSATAIWNFKWIAPATGTGEVTFYGAFAVTRNSVRKSTLVIPEFAAQSVWNISAEPTKIIVYPNPSSENILLKHTLTSDNAQVFVYDLQGKIMLNTEVVILNKEASIRVADFANGQYFIRLVDGKNNYSASFIKE